MGLFDWLFGKSQKQKEFEEKPKAYEVKRQLESETQRAQQLQAAEEESLWRYEVEQKQKRIEEKELEEKIKKQREAKLQQEQAEQKRQAIILRQQKLDQEARRQQAERERLAGELRIASLLKRQQEEVQRNFCETDTTYCANLNRLYERNPTNFKFSTIRSLTKDCGVHHELQRGVKQLDSYEQLSHYIFAFGLMHQAKLQQAYHSVFSNNHLAMNGQSIEIIDYGCGQGIGTICLIDYIKEQTNRNCKIVNVKLIEPSILALRGCLSFCFTDFPGHDSYHCPIDKCL